MYLAVDIGGTKTLIACFDDDGNNLKESQFPTPIDYTSFTQQLETAISQLGVNDYRAGCIAGPGRIDRENGVGIAFGNLPWENVPLQADLEKIINAPVIVENDAKLAGLSEAKLIINDFKKVLYITISTGIGVGVIKDGVIDSDFQDSEGGLILIEHAGKNQKWESFASGKAIYEKYGMKAEKISDPVIWKEIAHNLSVGLIDLIAVIQPDVIIVGGGVGQYYQRFEKFLLEQLRTFETPLVPIPPIRVAQRPEEAVIYGCFELAKDKYGHIT